MATGFFSIIQVFQSFELLLLIIHNIFAFISDEKKKK